jgi:hypothetical protein
MYNWCTVDMCIFKTGVQHLKSGDYVTIFDLVDEYVLLSYQQIDNEHLQLVLLAPDDQRICIKRRRCCVKTVEH